MFYKSIMTVDTAVIFAQSTVLDINTSRQMWGTPPVKLRNLRRSSAGLGGWKMWDSTPQDFFNIKSKSLGYSDFIFLQNMKS